MMDLTIEQLHLIKQFHESKAVFLTEILKEIEEDNLNRDEIIKLLRWAIEMVSELKREREGEIIIRSLDL